jgi:hypothetical protein
MKELSMVAGHTRAENMMYVIIWNTLVESQNKKFQQIAI